MSERRTLVSFDWAIKNILRDKANHDVLEGFLSTLLDTDITILSVLESEGNQQDESDKFNRVDLAVEDENGEIFIIEVQNSRERHYLQRLLYGTSKLVVDHISLGDSFQKVKKVISISILYFLFGEGENDYLYRGTTEFYGMNTQEALQLKPKKRQAVLGREITAGSIFPEYYLIEVERFHDIITKGIDEWIYLFKNSTVRPEFTSKNIQAAAEKLDLLKMSENERRAYERYMIDRASEKDMIKTARIEGKLEGRLEIAANMLKKGKSCEEIVEWTGLRSEQVRKLEQQKEHDDPTR
ncbi:MAG: hypothetical protein D3911_02360 [Candidatus Electrothrix sp. AW3_4]|nr:hypothetical protein [Candidatus Electrothrix gigas]